MQESKVKWQMTIFSRVCLVISLMLLAFPFFLWQSHKKQFSGSKTYFASTVGRNVATRKEAMKIIKISNNKKKLIEFGIKVI